MGQLMHQQHLHIETPLNSLVAKSVVHTSLLYTSIADSLLVCLILKRGRERPYVWFMPSVCSHMNLKMGLLSEDLST